MNTKCPCGGKFYQNDIGFTDGNDEDDFYICNKCGLETRNPQIYVKTKAKAKRYNSVVDMVKDSDASPMFVATTCSTINKKYKRYDYVKLPCKNVLDITHKMEYYPQYQIINIEQKNILWWVWYNVYVRREKKYDEE